MDRKLNNLVNSLVFLRLPYNLLFYPVSSGGNSYKLTVVFMLTSYTFCIPTKSELGKAYISYIYANFGGIITTLSDNGIEFIIELFTSIVEQLGVEHKVYCPPYYPESNREIKGIHPILKACTSKHVLDSLEWYHVVPLACTTYNIFQMNIQRIHNSSWCLVMINLYKVLVN